MKYKVLILTVMVTACMAMPVSDRAIASDRDVDPFMIYIDPVTGKYTTQKPGHDTPPGKDSKTGPDNTQGDISKPAITPIAPALIISGGLILLSYLVTLTLVRRG